MIFNECYDINTKIHHATNKHVDLEVRTLETMQMMFYLGLSRKWYMILLLNIHLENNLIILL